MKSVINKISAYVILQAVVSVVLGLFLILFPQTTTLTIMYVIAAYFAVIGVIGLLSYMRNKNSSSFVEGNLIGGIFEIIIALIVFIFPQSVAGLMAMLIGILVVLNGVLNMVRALEIKKHGDGKWMAVFIMNIVVTVFGIIIIVNPFKTVVNFVLILGIFLLAKGVVDLITYLIFIGAVKKAIKQEEKNK